MFRIIIFLLTLSFMGISSLVSMFNSQNIDLNLYFVSYTAPIPLFLFVSFLMGSFLALLFFFSAYIKHKHENMNLRRSMKIKEDEIDSMRKNPLRDDH